VVVGSALVRAAQESAEAGESREKAVESLVRKLVEACRRGGRVKGRESRVERTLEIRKL
jgi:hypothetical protein